MPSVKEGNCCGGKQCCGAIGGGWGGKDLVDFLTRGKYPVYRVKHEKRLQNREQPYRGLPKSTEGEKGGFPEN